MAKKPKKETKKGTKASGGKVKGKGKTIAIVAIAALVLLGGTLLMSATLSAGLVMRERRWIGFEGVSIPLIYLGVIALAVWS